MIKQFDCKKINGFCAIATLANVLRDDAFLEYIDSEEFIPSGHRQLSEILHREGYHDFFISPIIQFPDEILISKELFTSIISHKNLQPIEGSYMPFLLNVKMRKEDPYFHMTAILIFQDMILFSDPNNAEYIKLDSIAECFARFEVCTGIWVIEKAFKTQNQICCFKMADLFI